MMLTIRTEADIDKLYTMHIDDVQISDLSLLPLLGEKIRNNNYVTRLGLESIFVLADPATDGLKSLIAQLEKDIYSPMETISVYVEHHNVVYHPNAIFL
jgi:hypothetical protein